MSVRVRALFSPMRSGSTMLLHCLSQHPRVTCISGTVDKSGRLDADEISRSWERTLSWETERDYLFVKNTFDANVYHPFSDADVVSDVKPVFLFRDPVQTVNSIVSVGFMDASVGGAVKAYRDGVFEAYEKSRQMSPDATRCMTFESLTAAPTLRLRKLLRFWDIPWHDGVCNWSEPFTERSLEGDTVSNQRDAEDAIRRGHHQTLAQSIGILRRHVRDVSLSERDVRLVRTELQNIYDHIVEEESEQWRT